MKNCFYFLLFIVALMIAAPSHAQMLERSALQDRIDRLEHDLMLLQKQVARGEPVSMPAGASDVDNPAQLEVRLSNMEEEMRQMRGKIEENEFQARKLNESFEKLQRDVEFRFNQGAAGQPAAAPATADAGVTTSEGSSTPKPLASTEPAPQTTAPADPSLTTAGDGVLRAPDGNEDHFSTPREHYNYAFRLLNQTKYNEAATIFDSFIKKYPKDPLIGNAYYWSGETYYIRRDYVSAADKFRQGFEAMPNGQKAADNLLKLAMSLNALNRDKEACIVLGQVTTKFKQSSTTVTEKAAQEQKRIGCK